MKIIDKNAAGEAVKSALGPAYAGFDERPYDPGSCAFAAEEDIEASAWAGKWTETVRAACVSASGEGACVCVKPLPAGKIVWYCVSAGRKE